MSIHRLRRRLSVALLTMAMATRAAYAAPAAEIARVKAAECCAQHCDHRTQPTRPDDCCRVLSQATDEALLTVAPSADHPGIGLAAPLQETIGKELARSCVCEHALDPPRSSAPLFLAVRALRL